MPQSREMTKPRIIPPMKINPRMYVLRLAVSPFSESVRSSKKRAKKPLIEVKTIKPRPNSPFTPSTEEWCKLRADGRGPSAFHGQGWQAHLERTVGGSKPWLKNSIPAKSSPSRNSS